MRFQTSKIQAVILVKLWFLFAITDGFASITDYPQIQLRQLIQKQCTTTEVVSEVTPYFETYYRSSGYDQSVYWVEQPPFNSLAIFDKFGSSNCVGVGQHLVRKFPLFQLIPSRLPNVLREEKTPQYDHVAAIAFCQDGYVILDPTMLISAPIIVRPAEATTVDSYGDQYWTLEVQPSTTPFIQVQINFRDHPLSPQQKENQAFIYRLEEVLNPDEAITNPLQTLDNKVLTFGYPLPAQPYYTLVVRIAKRRVEFGSTLSNDNSRIKLHTLSFDDYKKAPEESLTQLFEHPDIVRLNINPIMLKDRIRAILEHFLKKESHQWLG
jgi:hypothetical protein